MSRKLHIGGKQRAAGWEVLNVVPGPAVDHVSDAADLSRFADDTFEEVYASHVLEHFDYVRELVPVLREWRRVLTPNGSLRISVPDLDILCRMFADRQKLAFKEKMQIVVMMFGAHENAHDYHKVGLSLDILLHFLGQAGFRTAERVSDLGRFDDTSRLVFKGIPISLNVVATK